MRCVLTAISLALSAPGLALAAEWNCVLTQSCSVGSGCASTKVSYGLAERGGGWTVTDVYNGTEIVEVAVERMEGAISLRWRAGGVWRNELALTELVVAEDGAAAMSSIGMNSGRLGATVLTGRCAATKAGSAER